MSSHHTIREGQEPGVIVLTPDYNSEYLGQLLEWAPRLWANHSAAEHILAEGIKVEGVVATEIEQLQENYPDINWVESQDSIESWLKVLNSLNQTEVVVFTSKLDTQWFKIAEEHKLSVKLIIGDFQYTVIHNGYKKLIFEPINIEWLDINSGEQLNQFESYTGWLSYDNSPAIILKENLN